MPPCICLAPYGQVLSVGQHHPVGIDLRKAQTTVISSDGGVHVCCQQCGAFGIGVQVVRNQILAVDQRCAEVDQFGSGGMRHVRDQFAYAVAPFTGAGTEATVSRADRGHVGHYDAHVGVHRAQGVGEPQIVAHECVAVIGPVARVGVVGAEMDHGYVRRKLKCMREFCRLAVRVVAFPEQCGTVAPEVAHLIAFAKRLLQARRI
ncbi:hypothetical protein IMSAGC006_02232 [Muribaculaceae bacterium]|nr:hypothetical protein IMSAGC006_02232 [Muribaculaceae bacterium]